MNWRAKAACRGLTPEVRDRVFFPDPPKPRHARDYREALKVCAGCPVQEDCLDWALEHNEVDDGIWGGRTPQERQRLMMERYGARVRCWCEACGFPFFDRGKRLLCPGCKLAEQLRSAPVSWVEDMSRAFARKSA